MALPYFLPAISVTPFSIFFWYSRASIDSPCLTCGSCICALSFNLQCSKKPKCNCCTKIVTISADLAKKLKWRNQKKPKKIPKLAKCPSNEMCNRIHNLFGAAQLPPPLPGCTLHQVRVRIGVCFGIFFFFWEASSSSSSSSTAENAPQTITYKLLNCIIAPVESVFGFCCCCRCFCWG